MIFKSEKVSVVIRTRSRPKSLCQAIESVLFQTWKNIEVIVVNDGAPVNLGEFVKFIDRGLVTLLSTKEKGSRSHAANIGWKSATGDMVLFLDDDDLLLKNHVKELVTVLRKNPWCSIAFSGALKEDCHGKRMLLELHTVDLPALAKENLFPLHCALVRKSAIEAVNGFDESIEMFEDWDLWLTLLLAGFEFAAVEQWSAVYRIHDTSTIKSSPFGSKKDINARWKVLIKHESKIRKSLATTRESSRLRTLLCIFLFKIVKRLL